MYRHDLDPIALVFGALFTIVGLAFAFGRWTWLDLNGGWALAILLVALGLAGILGSALRAQRAQTGSTLPTDGDVGE
jgi:hypothetical protein